MKTKQQIICENFLLALIHWLIKIENKMLPKVNSDVRALDT